MIALLLTVLIVFGLLVLNEWWWRGRTHGEISRKLIHISVGSFVAFWPYFLTWQQIELLSVAFIVVILLSQKLKLFKAIHSVQRPTWGEVYFAVSVGLIAIMTHTPAIYAVALLHMSLADGMAAIIGVKYGSKSAYQIFGFRKSLAGSAAFFSVSIILLVAFALNQNIALTPLLLVVALGATAIENVAVRGLDNLVIPIFIALALSQLV